jgi:Ca2+-binding RTX toxin-like protein
VLKVNGTNDQVTIKNWFASTQNRVEQVVFNDGPLWDGSYLSKTAITGTAAADTIFALNGVDDILYGLDGNDQLEGYSGNDTIYGGNGNDLIVGWAGDDVLDGGAGNDTLYGGDGRVSVSGNDTYLFGLGDGQDTIIELNSGVADQDTLQMKSGIGNDQLWFRHVGNNLEVSIIGTNDKVTVQNWYTGSANHVEQFRTTDGHLLLDSQVENLVQAMAVFSPPAAGQTTLPQNYQDQLAPVLAANWQ